MQRSAAERLIPIREDGDFPARRKHDRSQPLDSVAVADKIVEMVDLEHACVAADHAAQGDDLDRRVDRARRTQRTPPKSARRHCSR
jgi:hypothetical protein